MVNEKNNIPYVIESLKEQTKIFEAQNKTLSGIKGKYRINKEILNNFYNTHSIQKELINNYQAKFNHWKKSDFADKEKNSLTILNTQISKMEKLNKKLFDMIKKVEGKVIN